MRKVINESDCLPSFYGAAWDVYTHERNSSGTHFLVVCYPIPLNLIFRGIRNIYYKLSQVGRLSDKDRLLYFKDILKETREELDLCQQKVQMLRMLNAQIDTREE